MGLWSRLARPVYKNTGSVARDHLASERTYLAWTRTGLGFVALGIAIERFSRLEMAYPAIRGQTSEENDNKDDGPGLRILVGTIMALGTGSIIYATRRYFVVMRLLEKGSFTPAYGGVATMGAIMSALSGGALATTAQGWRKDQASHRGVVAPQSGPEKK